MLEKMLISLGDPSETFVLTKYHYVSTAFDYLLSKSAGLQDTHHASSKLHEQCLHAQVAQSCMPKDAEVLVGHVVT